MDISTAENIIKNFTSSDWTSSNNITGVYNNDLSLQYIVDELSTSITDEYLPLETWSDFFDTYGITKKTTIHFQYDSAEITSKTIFFNDKIFIPMPVGANMITTFYKEEIAIVKYLSTDSCAFLKFQDSITQTQKDY